MPRRGTNPWDHALVLRGASLHERQPGDAICGSIESQAVACGGQDFHRLLVLDLLPAVARVAGLYPGVVSDDALGYLVPPWLLNASKV